MKLSIFQQFWEILNHNLCEYLSKYYPSFISSGISVGCKVDPIILSFVCLNFYIFLSLSFHGVHSGSGSLDRFQFNSSVFSCVYTFVSVIFEFYISSCSTALFFKSLVVIKILYFLLMF